MIDHILGRPSATFRRSQIFLVLFFWVWRLYKGDGALALTGSTPTSSAARSLPSRRIGPPTPGLGVGGRDRKWWLRLWISIVGRRPYGIGWIGKINERLKHFTPYQLVLGTLTIMYAIRHLDDLFGLGAPEPLARLYTRSYYRATYVNTAFDAGFASAMTIRPKWLKDICSVLFAGYYLVWANEGDEVLRRFRAMCTVEMLRVTWEKTNNPYVRLITTFHRPKLPIIRHVTIPRPASSSRSSLPPVKAMLFFSGTEAEFAASTQLIVDFPGGGFVAMGPECHEERLRTWAKRTGKPVLGINYGKAPEYPYPWAIEEGFDAYRTLMETRGSCIGIKSKQLGIVLTGDSAGGNICTTIMLRILEHPTRIPRPISIVLAYPALDFNFTSWMSPTNLRVLRSEQSETHIPGIMHGKDHMRHRSPLSVVDDVDRKRGRQRSWGETISSKLPFGSPSQDKAVTTGWMPRSMSQKLPWAGDVLRDSSDGSEEDEDIPDSRRDADRPLRERVKTPKLEKTFVYPEPGPEKPRKKAPIGTRLTMTSRVGYFQDRIISPSMMRAMAILYIGPRRCPDFETDYYISPILSPPDLLAYFPPVYLICGEKDPFVDDTVIFAGKIREAKRTRRAQAETAVQGKSAKFGETLRMSNASSSAKEQRGKDKRDPILDETDEDWVQMRIIEGWGHGFMQMTSLMREVDAVLNEMADWIDESFVKAKQEKVPVIITPELPVKPARAYKSTTTKPLGGADLGTPISPAQDEDNVVSFTPKSKRRLPPSNFNPVPRRSSKDSDLHRSSSAPRFDLDETGSSGEAMSLVTPPLSIRSLPQQPAKGSATFAFFGKRPVSPTRARPIPPVNLYSTSGRRTSDTGSTLIDKPTNSLVAAAVAGARAASPALAAAGLVPQEISNVSEGELMRRRRMEAVFGMGETDSALVSDAEDDD